MFFIDSYKYLQVKYAELQNLPSNIRSYGVDKDGSTVYSQVAQN